MKEELRFIIVGIVKSLVSTGGLSISTSLLENMSNVDNWSYISSKHQIINQSSMWCYEYIPINEVQEKYFLQVELQTEFKTVMAINVITNEKAKIVQYS
jgi:hypothetical protein